MEILSNYVAGQFDGPSTQRWLDNVAPATGAVRGKVPDSGRADVDRAVVSARAAMEGSWGRTSWNERADLLDAIADGLYARSDELAALESADQGKPRSLAARVDIPRAIANFRFFAGAVRHQSTGCHEMADAINYTLRQPVGVIGLITPWNLPLYLLSWKVAPALACGNAVIAKPSELTPSTASALAEVIHEVGLPPGVFNLVHGRGAEVGAALVEHPRVDAISFTGGTATGEHVGAAAARTHKKASLELGGKNPTIVFDDCDFDAAVDGAVRAGFTNQGEICLCGSRLFVHSAIYKRFVAACVEKVNALKVGDPSHPSTDVGALVSAAHRDKVASYVALAVEEGGTLDL